MRNSHMHILAIVSWFAAAAVFYIASSGTAAVLSALFLLIGIACEATAWVWVRRARSHLR